MQRKTVYLVDHLWGGHHSIYFKHITKVALELGYTVCALCPEPLDLENWIKKEVTCDYSLSVFRFEQPSYPQFLPRKLQEISRVISLWRSTHQSIQKISQKIGLSPDLVFFPWLDSYLGGNLIPLVVDAIFPYQWSGIYFQPRHLRNQKRFQRLRRGPLNPHSVLNSSNCQSVAVLDEGVIEYLACSLSHTKVYPFPDFADASSPDYDFPIIYTIEEKARGRKIVGLVGSLEKRKGIMTLLEVAKSDQLPNCFFVFAGQFEEKTFSPTELQAIKLFIDTNPDNAFFYLNYISDESKFNALISICDVLFAAYDYPHSSNLLTKACIFEKPVVASNLYCIGERVKKYNLGQGIQPNSVNDCLQALKSLCSDEANARKDLEPQYSIYKEEHSLQRLYGQLFLIFP